MQLRLQVTLSTLVFVLILVFSNTGFAQLPVGVKKGDWIEYNVTYTGDPFAGHNINWARMEILDVRGDNITVKISSRLSSGSVENITSILNLASGHMIDDFIVPANLKRGDKFYDENYGNMTITKAEPHEYAGASRTVVYAITNSNTYVWDQTTGVSVEGNSQASNYTMHSIVASTNMWHQSVEISGLLIGLLVALVLVVIGLVLAAALFYKKRKQNHAKNS
jgi:hypothetical protein